MRCAVAEHGAIQVAGHSHTSHLQSKGSAAAAHHFCTLHACPHAVGRTLFTAMPFLASLGSVSQRFSGATSCAAALLRGRLVRHGWIGLVVPSSALDGSWNWWASACVTVTVPLPLCLNSMAYGQPQAVLRAQTNTIFQPPAAARCRPATSASRSSAARGDPVLLVGLAVTPAWGAVLLSAGRGAPGSAAAVRCSRPGACRQPTCCHVV